MNGQWGLRSNRAGNVAPPVDPAGRPTLTSRNRNRRWWLFATVLAVVAVTVLVITTRSSSGSSSPGSTVPRTSRAPTDVLLSAEEVEAVMKTSMTDEGPAGELPSTGVAVNPGKCTGAFDPFDSLTMAQVDSTYIMATQNVVERARADRHVAQAATIFASSSDARRFFDRQSMAWKACAGGALTAFFPRADKTQHYTLGTPGVRGDVLTLSLGNDRRQCQRAIGVKIDVIVDVRACGPIIGSEGAAIATDMLAKIP